MKRGRSPAAIALPALRDAAAAASTGPAGEAAHLALAAGGSAADAVVAGFFAAAGAAPGVLLGSAAALVANVGSKVRAFDGRPLQPGKGAPRPRGLIEGVSVPDAARVGVPRAVPMLQLLHAYGGRSGLSSLAKHGADAALSVGAKERAKVLRRVGAAGVIGLRTEGVHEALLAAGNTVAGGILTEADLDTVLPADADAQLLLDRSDALVAGWPWAAEEAVEEEAGAGGAKPGSPLGPRDLPGLVWTIDVVAAVDSRGGVAVLAVAYQREGVPLPAVELSAPRVAVPVRRGVTRVSPGTVLRAPGPIGVARFGRELTCAFGLAGEQRAGESDRLGCSLNARALTALGEGAAVETALAALARDNGAARTVAAVRSPKAARSSVVVPDAAPAQ